MNAKEKAAELVAKYRPLVTTWDCYWDAPRDDKEILKDAKKCALIAVDEMMQVLKILFYGIENVSLIDYWNQVKQEIEKL